MTGRRLVLAAVLALAACGSRDDTTASPDADAMAAATNKAVADTDAALRDAAAAPGSPSPSQTQSVSQPSGSAEQTAN